MVLAPWTGEGDYHHFGTVLIHKPRTGSTPFRVQLRGRLFSIYGDERWSWCVTTANEDNVLEGSPQDYATKAEARAACSLAVAAALLRGDYEAT